ncbi:MAG TPA: GNAT family N-acetyltransferase [Hanamia sp.]|jgi:ribosomal-protein-alanine N-acetyltransferase|nr:GNAT family N-acetyltransferase [Hanamia sp.]
MLRVNFNPFPEIKTERLLLRRLIKEDVEQIYKMRSDKNVMKFIGKNPITTMQEAVDFFNLVNDSLENSNGITWAMSLKDCAEKLIGTIGLWRLIKEHFRAEIGYMLLPEYWKKGLTKEAVLKVNQYGFEEMKLHSIEAHIHPKNTASATLLESTGFVREAYFKEDFFFNGAFEDTAIYSLLAKK